MKLETTRPQSDDPGLTDLATFNKAVSEPLRLEVLRVLRNNSFGVLELSHILNVKQSALSHHLKILAQSSLVATRREGNSIFYRRCHANCEDRQALQQALYQIIDQQALSEETCERIKHVQSERAASSTDFFHQNADRFQEQQELIATHAIYGTAVKELINDSNLQQHTLALEVGPGSGEFLRELSPRFKQVIALDNSSAMLQQAKTFCAQEQLSNVSYIHADTHEAVKQNISADCVVVNMVLHHTPSPADIFNDLYHLTSNNGLLVITELCHHDQHWVTEACGDVWFGFEPEELLDWAKAAGFHQQESVYHALRNGFQIQMHSFTKSIFSKPD